jgi:hypothetical protein
MSNRIITPEEMAKSVWGIFEKVADEHGLDAKDRAKCLDAISAGMFYAPTFKGPKK